ncbi:MAG: hypothetical protein NVSMB16_09270 [Acidimicrobiales bacterium]
MDPHRWLDLFAAELGVDPPTPEESEALLDLAGAAARASERTAAPLTCWLAARAGVAPSAALAIARRLAVAAAGETEGG